MYTSSPKIDPLVHSIMENLFPSSTDSRRASCQFLATEWALSTGKLIKSLIIHRSKFHYAYTVYLVIMFLEKIFSLLIIKLRMSLLIFLSFVKFYLHHVQYLADL